MAAKDVRWINHIKKWYDDVNPILDTPRLLGAQQTLRSVPARIGCKFKQAVNYQKEITITFIAFWLGVLKRI